ncbi:MAG: hypothetical protein AAB316_13155, partial [Bacteroidota bacterium]
MNDPERLKLGSSNSPAPVEYFFELKEILPGANPNDAFDFSLSVFETTTMSPTLLYSQSEPQLEPGKIYAWRVTAKSALWAGLLFQNNGKSEVCSFTYTGSGGDPFDPFGGSGGGGTGGGNPFGGGSGNPFGGGVGSPSGVGGGGGGTFGSSGLAAEQKEEQRVPPSGCEVFDTDYGTVKGNG